MNDVEMILQEVKPHMILLDETKSPSAEVPEASGALSTDPAGTWYHVVPTEMEGKKRSITSGAGELAVINKNLSVVALTIV